MTACQPVYESMSFAVVGLPGFYHCYTYTCPAVHGRPTPYRGEANVEQNKGSREKLPQSEFVPPHPKPNHLAQTCITLCLTSSTPLHPHSIHSSLTPSSTQPLPCPPPHRCDRWTHSHSPAEGRTLPGQSCRWVPPPALASAVSPTATLPPALHCSGPQAGCQ